jgi:hypothetical protein
VSDNIIIIIEKMLEIIPEKETKLITELKEYSENKWNIAPECLREKVYFQEVANILNNNILNIDYELKKKLLKVFK